MMNGTLTTIRAIEYFHLALLDVLPTRLDHRHYILKGGANLRYFFDSPRYSEDVDFDASGIRKADLETRVDRVLGGRSISAILRVRGLRIETVAKPKQTETTQRWKLVLARNGSSEVIRTRIEFSRRGTDSRYQLGRIPEQVVRPYALRSPTVLRYLRPAMIKQKVEALAGRSETQARDAFDLDLLFRGELEGIEQIDSSARVAAAERTMELPSSAFRDQVLAFLDPDVAELYSLEDSWERIQRNVVEHLVSTR